MKFVITDEDRDTIEVEKIDDERKVAVTVNREQAVYLDEVQVGDLIHALRYFE